jgi:hypothetical protein
MQALQRAQKRDGFRETASVDGRGDQLDRQVRIRALQFDKRRCDRGDAAPAAGVGTDVTDVERLVEASEALSVVAPADGLSIGANHETPPGSRRSS